MKMENQFWFLECHHSNKSENETYSEYMHNRELYYDHDKRKWVKRHEYTGHCYPATFPCHSYRAAKRHLKAHDEIPKGMKFVLVSRFAGGFDRFLTK